MVTGPTAVYTVFLDAPPVAINTVEGNSGDRVKLGKRSLSDPAILGFINNVGPDEQPTGWDSGLVSAKDTGGTRTR